MQSNRNGPNQLLVSRRVYRGFWLAVISVWSLNCLLAGLFAVVYHVGLTTNDGYALKSTGLLSPRYAPFVIVVYALIAIYYWYLLGRAVIASVRLQALSFKQSHTKTRSTMQKSCPLFLRWCLPWHRVGSSVTYDCLITLRELLEIVMKTYRAYKCSVLISQEWVNHVFVSILAMNCWAAPLIHSLVPSNPVIKHVLYLACDLILDLATTFVIPVCIITSVIRVALRDQVHLENNAEEYAFDVPYGDVFLTNLFRGAQQVCAVSLFDFAAKLLPFISMANCLGQITDLVRPYHPTHIRPFDIVPCSPRITISRSNCPTTRTLTRKQVWIRGPTWLGVSHAVCIVWGVVIVVCHLSAQCARYQISSERLAGCKSSARPWFAEKYSCTTLELNCYRRSMSGSAAEIAVALDAFDLDGLSSLIITHCPELEMPAEISKLRNLHGLEITNATLVAWDQQAALTSTNHPALKFVTLVRVNMTSIPTGMQAQDFPGVTDIAIVESNITTRGFPDDLDTKWTQVFNLYIERTALTSIPRSVAQLRVNRLSLFMNNITAISAETIVENRFNVLSFARNPVMKWPESIGDVDRLTLILVDYTEISSLPTWLVEESRRRGSMGTKIMVSAGGTPYCRTVAGPAMDDVIFEGLQVVCREKPDRAIQAYPMAFNSINRIP